MKKPQSVIRSPLEKVFLSSWATPTQKVVKTKILKYTEMAQRIIIMREAKVIFLMRLYCAAERENERKGIQKRLFNSRWREGIIYFIVCTQMRC